MVQYTQIAPSGVTVHSCKPFHTYGFRDNHRQVFRVTSWFIYYYKNLTRIHRNWKASR